MPSKQNFPVERVRQYLEPGPIVLVSSRWRGKNNIMTMGWHMVMEFTPSLVGCLISGGNHSHRMIRNSGECVINLPTTKLTDEVIAIGNSSGAEIDKFKEFDLTAEKANGGRRAADRRMPRRFRVPTSTTTCWSQDFAQGASTIGRTRNGSEEAPPAR